MKWLTGSTPADLGAGAYHRTLGWHFRFYLFHPVEAGQIDLRWYPSDVYLADNAARRRTGAISSPLTGRRTQSGDEPGNAQPGAA